MTRRSPIDDVKPDVELLPPQAAMPRTTEAIAKLSKRAARLEQLLRDRDAQLQEEVSARQALWETLQKAKAQLHAKDREIEALRKLCQELAMAKQPSKKS
jgi:chromosome segregation ATPase